MKVAVISLHGCPCIPPGGVDAGGMNVYVRETSQLLARSGYSVEVFSRHHANVDHTLWVSEPGVDLVHIPAGAVSLKKEELPGILDEFTELVDAHFNRGVDSYDVITSHYWFSGVVACELSKQWDVPHVSSFHTVAQIKLNAYVGSSELQERIRAEPVIARDADKIVAWTEEESHFIASEFGARSDKIEIIPPGVDTDLFKAMNPPDSTSAKIQETGGSIIYVGRMDALKGVDLLIESLPIIRAQVPNTTLQIVGGGSEEEWERVRQLSKRCGVEQCIELLGVQPQSELPRRYSRADVIVAPSYHETFGMAVLEASACGTPAVAADVDGLRSIVVDGVTGYLVSGRTVDAYAESVFKILGNDELRRKMSLAARQRALQMTWSRSVERLANLYQNVVRATKVESSAT